MFISFTCVSFVTPSYAMLNDNSPNPKGSVLATCYHYNLQIASATIVGEAGTTINSTK